MAIITSYRASKIYGMSVEALTKQRKKNPRPAYFVDIKDYDHPKIDDKDPSWIYYTKRYNARMSRKKHASIDKDLDKLITAVDDVIRERYNEEEVFEVRKLIAKKLKD